MKTILRTLSVAFFVSFLTLVPFTEIRAAIEGPKPYIEIFPNKPSVSRDKCIQISFMIGRLENGIEYYSPDRENQITYTIKKPTGQTVWQGKGIGPVWLDITNFYSSIYIILGTYNDINGNNLQLPPAKFQITD